MMVASKMDKKLEIRIKEICHEVWKALEVLDWCRIDIKCDKENNPYVLEINPLPSLSSADVFTCIANYLNVRYEEMIRRILDAALTRCGLK